MEQIINIISAKKKSLKDSEYTDNEIEKYLTDAFELAMLRTLDSHFKNLSEDKFAELQASLVKGDLEASRKVFNTNETNDAFLEKILTANLSDIFTIK